MRAFVIALFICLPAMVFAERIMVRSGEHADFSRLVFEFDGPVEWEMGRFEHGYEIRLKKPNIVIDISDVYQRIPHDRIKSISISKDSARLNLVLGCDCHADAFEFRQGVLVVDIKDGPPTGASGFEKTFTSDEMSTIQAVDENLPEVTEDSGKPAASTLLSANELHSPITHFPKQRVNPRVGVFSGPEPVTENTVKAVQDSAVRISKMQSEMLHQIGRAAAQGLLKANLPQLVEAQPEPDEPPPVPTRKESETPVQPHVNIHIESSVDRELESMLRTNLLTEEGAVCLPKNMFDVVDWGNPEAVFDQIIVQRSRISGEFDKVDKQAVVALVRAYIYAGFGAEAQNALNAFNVTQKDAEVLTVMASIVDRVPPTIGSKLDGQISCDSAVALWSALAMPTLTKGMEINHASVLGEFSSLPLHLRRLLGPSLAQKFLDIDDIETARALRNAIARSPGEAGPEFRLLDAKLDQTRGMHTTAEQTLEKIVNEDSGVAPRALVELLEAKLENETEISEDLLTSAQSYIFEQQNTEISAHLTRVIALARGKSGDFHAALETLREMEISRHIDASIIGQTWEKILLLATTEAPDEAFLQFIFASRDDLEHQKIARDIRRKAAARLLDGSFSKMATILLAAPTSPTADDRMLLARVAIVEGKPEDAITILKHVSGEEAVRIRAHAYGMLGKHMDAAHEYETILDQDNQHSEAWRAGDWGRLDEFGSRSEKAAAQFMMAEKPAPDPIDGGIEKDGFLLEASTAARHSIETLLKEYPAVVQEGS